MLAVGAFIEIDGWRRNYSSARLAALLSINLGPMVGVVRQRITNVAFRWA
jgi:hypothetical protein